MITMSLQTLQKTLSRWFSTTLYLSMYKTCCHFYPPTESYSKSERRAKKQRQRGWQGGSGGGRVTYQKNVGNCWWLSRVGRTVGRSVQRGANQPTDRSHAPLPSLPTSWLCTTDRPEEGLSAPFVMESQATHSHTLCNSSGQVDPTPPPTLPNPWPTSSPTNQFRASSLAISKTCREFFFLLSSLPVISLHVQTGEISSPHSGFFWVYHTQTYSLYGPYPFKKSF